MPRYATVQPQHWIRDYAVDCADAFTIDVTETLANMTPEHRAAVEADPFNSFVSDDLWDHVMPDGSTHNGPFYVDLHPEGWEA